MQVKVAYHGGKLMEGFSMVDALGLLYSLAD
jgi:hypothetical protein